MLNPVNLFLASVDVAGNVRVVGNSFPGVAALRSEALTALTTYAAGPTADPRTILSVISAVGVNDLQKSPPAICNRKKV